MENVLETDLLLIFKITFFSMYCVFVCKRARVAVKAQSVVSSPLPHEFQDLTSGCKAWPQVLRQLSHLLAGD